MALPAILAAAALGAASAPGGTVTLRADAEVSRPQVRLGDVALLDGLPAAVRSRLAAVPVGRFRAGERRIELSPAWIAERIRGAVPAMAAGLTVSGEPVVVRLVPTAAGEEAAAPLVCAQLLAPIGAGAVPLRSDFAPASCSESVAAFRYDRRIGAARAVRDVAAGEIVAAIPDALLADVRPGDALLVSSSVGPVTVERQVTAVQAGRRGRSFFARTSDGAVVPALLPEEPR